jgi:uncharacterized protein DUF6788
MILLDNVRYQDVKQKSHHHLARPHPSGDNLHSKCGKLTCRCRQDPRYLHGPYYRWIGWINGKPTTKNVSEECAQECQRRIENYKELQKNIDKTVADALDQAPWTQAQKK